MYISDKRILRLIDYLKFIKRIDTDKQFCEEIGMLEQTLSKIKKGLNHFTVMQIQTIGKVFNVNYNWIFAIENKVFNSPESIEITDV